MRHSRHYNKWLRTMKWNIPIHRDILGQNELVQATRSAARAPAGQGLMPTGFPRRGFRWSANQ
jgi:hypothetical protein